MATASSHPGWRPRNSSTLNCEMEAKGMRSKITSRESRSGESMSSGGTPRNTKWKAARPRSLASQYPWKSTGR